MWCCSRWKGIRISSASAKQCAKSAFRRQRTSTIGTSSPAGCSTAPRRTTPPTHAHHNLLSALPGHHVRSPVRAVRRSSRLIGRSPRRCQELCPGRRTLDQAARCPVRRRRHLRERSGTSPPPVEMSIEEMDAIGPGPTGDEMKWETRDTRNTIGGETEQTHADGLL